MNRIGTLYVVATPIGNLQDITLRAIDMLKNVDRVVAEDTQHSSRLLKHFSIQKPSLSMHEFNERERIDLIISYLMNGESIALISDAGTPLVSDPGYHLIKAAREKCIPVVPLPGPCAAIAALSVAGLPTDKFVFEGFLPAKQEARCQRLKSLRHESRTMIFYEAPHRLLDTLQDMLHILGGEKKAVVARELTKIHESVLTLNLSELMQYYSLHSDEQRGEIVILVEGENKEKALSVEVVPEEVLAILLEDLPLKQAVTLASKITRERKNIMYEIALDMKK